MTERPSPEFSERYYLAFCFQYGLDPEDQQSAREFEEWWAAVHPDHD